MNIKLQHTSKNIHVILVNGLCYVIILRSERLFDVAYVWIVVVPVINLWVLADRRMFWELECYIFWMLFKEAVSSMILCIVKEPFVCKLFFVRSLKGLCVGSFVLFVNVVNTVVVVIVVAVLVLVIVVVFCFCFVFVLLFKFLYV